MTIKPTIKQVDSHERDGASTIVVCGRVVDPGGKVKVVDYTHRFVGFGRSVIHQVVVTDVTMVNPIHPEPVMT